MKGKGVGVENTAGSEHLWSGQSEAADGLVSQDVVATEERVSPPQVVAEGAVAVSLAGVALETDSVAAEEVSDAAERFDTRDATAADIPAMVELDLVAFRRVNAGKGWTDDQLRSHMTAMFEARFRLLGGELMPVVTQQTADGGEEIVGFTHLMRTNSGPDDFVSWEDTTVGGWLTERHVPDGRNMYVVTLTMSPKVAREDAPNLLVARARGIMVKEGCDLIYSESRMPGLQGWVRAKCRASGESFEGLSEERVTELATEYFGLTRNDPNSGMVLPRDPMLAFCVQIGNMPQRLVANAYNDEQSMNYGAVCVMANPLLAHERTAERIARVSQLFLRAAHSLDQANALIFGEMPIN